MHILVTALTQLLTIMSLSGCKTSVLGQATQGWSVQGQSVQDQQSVAMKNALDLRGMKQEASELVKIMLQMNDMRLNQQKKIDALKRTILKMALTCCKPNHVVHKNSKYLNYYFFNCRDVQFIY